jgi:hypothetical protein
MDDTTQMLVDMIKKTGIDGFYLDTMENVPVKFRRAVDEAVPGVVFCTELQPIDGKTVETLTGSWQQSAALPYQVPILRYIVPEHHSPFIDRWTIDSKRDDMLKKAIVNGSGVVIWQDVFGTWLPFEEYQKANVRKWKAIWSENKECFNSNEVIPVWPSLDNKLVINAFISETTQTAIFTAYNDGDEAVDGKIALPVHSGVARVSELWSDNKVWIEDGAVCAHIQPKQVAIIRMEK